MKDYNFIHKKPVARFFYKGDHSHPVKRTVILTEVNDSLITGYELREGNETRDFKEAPIKTYRKDRIAKVNQIDKRRILRKTADKFRLKRSTMVRQSLGELVKHGI